MTESIGSFEMVNIAGSEISGGGDKELIEKPSRYKVVTLNKLKNKRENSIWKYMGIAEQEQTADNDKFKKNCDRIICLICFQRGKVHIYKRSTSSGNLWRHLVKKHKIPLPRKKGTAIKVKFPNEESIDKFLIDDDEPTLFTSDQNILNISLTEKLSNSFKNSVADESDLYKDIGSALIAEVAKRPELYEWNHGMGRKARRDVLWQEVYEALGCVVEVGRLHQMWKNIRDRYRKIRNSERDGAEFGTRYKYYDQLKFLDCEEFIEESNTENTADEGNIDIEVLNESDFDEPAQKKVKIEFSELLEISPSLHHSLKQSPEASLQSTGSLVTQNDEHLEDQPDEAHETNEKESSSKVFNCANAVLDEYDLFGRLVAEKLRQLPKAQVNQLEIKILQLLSGDN